MNEAYQLYLHGRYFWKTRTSGNKKKATELLRAATEKDPKFALAYAGLADCYAVSYYYIGERNRDVIGPNPNALQPGMRLRVPRD